MDEEDTRRRFSLGATSHKNSMSSVGVVGGVRETSVEFQSGLLSQDVNILQQT
jgi:hypothetical protein